jgi:hypothetical protein
MVGSATARITVKTRLQLRIPTLSPNISPFSILTQEVMHFAAGLSTQKTIHTLYPSMNLIAAKRGVKVPSTKLGFRMPACVIVGLRGTSSSSGAALVTVNI